MIQEFEVLAKQIISMAKENKPAELVRKKTVELIDKATPILTEYQRQSPNCQEFLSIVINKKSEMMNLKLSEIEKLYHDGDALPEANDECYNAKELLVHPATVYIITNNKYNQSGREQIVEELEELLAHSDIL